MCVYVCICVWQKNEQCLNAQSQRSHISLDPLLLYHSSETHWSCTYIIHFICNVSKHASIMKSISNYFDFPQGSTLGKITRHSIHIFNLSIKSTKKVVRLSTFSAILLSVFMSQDSIKTNSDLNTLNGSTEFELQRDQTKCCAADPQAVVMSRHHQENRRVAAGRAAAAGFKSNLS